MNDRMITAGMSAKLVSNLVKRAWTVRRIAKAVDASPSFIEGVRAKRHVLTVRDIETLAQRSGQSFNMMIVESFPVTARNRGLIEASRNLVQVCESPIPDAPARKPSRRRPQKRAA
jgi:hypothetical protein